MAWLHHQPTQHKKLNLELCDGLDVIVRVSFVTVIEFEIVEAEVAWVSFATTVK